MCINRCATLQEVTDVKSNLGDQLHAVFPIVNISTLGFWQSVRIILKYLLQVCSMLFCPSYLARTRPALQGTWLNIGLQLRFHSQFGPRDQSNLMTRSSGFCPCTGHTPGCLTVFSCNAVLTSLPDSKLGCSIVRSSVLFTRSRWSQISRRPHHGACFGTPHPGAATKHLAACQVGHRQGHSVGFCMPALNLHLANYEL